MSTVDKILSDMYSRPITGKTIASDASNAKAFISVDEDSVTLCPTEHTGVKIDENGLSMLGHFSLNSSFDDFSIGALWELNPTQMSYTPSTAATPVPAFLPSNPLSAVARFANKLKTFAEML